MITKMIIILLNLKLSFQPRRRQILITYFAMTTNKNDLKILIVDTDSNLTIISNVIYNFFNNLY